MWSIDANSVSRTISVIISSSNIWVMTLTVSVTWRHRSRDHWTHNWLVHCNQPSNSYRFCDITS